MKRQISFILLFGFVNLLVGQTSLEDSLQCFYPFNNNANDESGNGHDAFVNGAMPTTDRFHQEDAAYFFDGVDDYINSFSTFDYPERSLSLWVKPYNISSVYPLNQIVISQDDYHLKYGMLRVDFDSGMLNLWAGGINNNYTTQADEFLNKWTFVVLIRDFDSVSYYINATFGRTDVSNDSGSVYNPYSRLIIGAGRSLENQFFHGEIDDVRIYNRVLSEEEIEELFHLGTSVNQFESNIFNIYPNPATNDLFINYSGQSTDYDVSVIDVAGRIVFQGENIQRLNISTFVSGLYIIKFKEKSGKQSIERKFIKQ